MVAFIHKIELRIEWIWQIGAESIWPKNHAFTDGTLHSRPNGRSYHLLRLSSWLVTGEAALCRTMPAHSSVQVYTTAASSAHTHRRSPVRSSSTPMGKRQLVGGLAEPKWRISSIISLLSPEEETHLPNAHRTTERCPSVQRRRHGTRGTADRQGKQKAPYVQPPPRWNRSQGRKYKIKHQLMIWDNRNQLCYHHAAMRLLKWKLVKLVDHI